MSEKEESKTENKKSEPQQWGNPLEFILSVIATAVGLGNVWRFPYLVYRWGGGPFLIPFFILLAVIGIPIFLLETSIGQFSGLPPSAIFGAISPLFSGVGYAAILINSIIGFFYNVLIVYIVHFFVMSIREKLKWADCSYFNNTLCFQIKNVTEDIKLCQKEKEAYALQNNVNINDLKSPSELYFYDTVLGISDSIEHLGGLQWELTVVLIACWIIVFLVLCKGVQILGKVSYFTATFPYVVMTILVVAGALLDGASEGVSFYLTGENGFNAANLFEPELWKDAAGQIFFALSACSGVLIAMGGFSPFKNNLIRDTFLVPILDIGTGFYAGFAIFTVLGNMAIQKCLPIKDVASAGPELAFIVYPEGLALMGQWAPLFSVMFFVMMMALGFGSEFGVMESTMTTVIGILNDRYKNSDKKVYLIRFIVALVYCLLSFVMVTKGGFYVLNLLGDKVNNPMLHVGLLQVIVVPWVYGTGKLIRDIESMVGHYPRWFWMFFIISWKFICPIVLIFLITFTYLPESLTKIKKIPLAVNGIGYPEYVEYGIGYIIEFLPLSIVIGCAIYQAFIHRNNLSALFKTDEVYYNKQQKHYASQALNQDEIIHETKNNETKINLASTNHSQPTTYSTFEKKAWQFDEDVHKVTYEISSF